MRTTADLFARLQKVWGAENHIWALTENILSIGVLAKSTSGQSYKAFTIVNYNSRVVIWGIFKSGSTLES